MSIQDVSPEKWQLSLDFLPGRAVVVEPVEERLSSDGGLLPIRQLDEKWGLTAGFAAQVRESRNAATHTLLEMVRMRTYGILAGYEDQNDHDALRSDSVFKLVAGRSPDDEDLASQPTLSRFENSVTAASLLRLQDWFVEQFAAEVPTLTGAVVLDVDVFDDPTYGDQQLTLFHGFYEQYQYLVRAWTCANNDQLVRAALLYGTAKAWLGAEDDLRYIVGQVRGARPDVQIYLRGDSGFATPVMYETCEELGIDYAFGLGMNAVLKDRSAVTLQQALRQFEETGQPQRLFLGFEYQAETWSRARWVVVKCEANAQGTNRRAVVTNRPGAQVLLAAAYDEYADRGEGENRNKELKCDLAADRLSDHRFMANCFRLFLHCLAHNLLVKTRRLVAMPPRPHRTDLPPEAFAGHDRRRRANDRRRADPLGEGHPCTWRQQLIKVAARITVTARRVWVRLSGTWPYLAHYLHVGRAALGLFCASSDTS